METGEDTGTSWTPGEQCRHRNYSKEVRLFVWNIIAPLPPPPVTQRVYRVVKRGDCACEVRTALTDDILPYTGWFCRVYRTRGIRRLGFSNGGCSGRTHPQGAQIGKSFRFFRFYIIMYMIFSVNSRRRFTVFHWSSPRRRSYKPQISTFRRR